jgi:hypothetical protein
LFEKLPVKSFSLIALLLERRLRCGILGIDDVLDRPGSFSEVTGKGITIDTFSSIIVAVFLVKKY